MKILVNDGISQEGEKILLDSGFEVVNEKIAQEDLPSKIAQFDAIIVRSATKVRTDLIDVSNLKVISRSGVGLDNIDVVHAKSKGIKVLNTPGASSVSVAELAIAHMLGLGRFLHLSNSAMRNGEWPKKQYSKGQEVTGKTLGVIGLGAIGKETAIRAKGLLMNVIAYDPFVTSNDLDIEMQSFENLLSNSDFISLHVPFDKEKGALISSDEISKMKDGVTLINCARGGVVDEKALLEGLNSGKIAYAGVDVFENEPATEDQKELINHPNVSVTPHIGASTKEAQLRVSIEIAERTVAALKELE
jgi:D-3-phosphoglycerate dehydrogenase